MRNGLDLGGRNRTIAVALTAAAISFNALFKGRVVIFLNIGLVLALFSFIAAGNESLKAIGLIKLLTANGIGNDLE